VSNENFIHENALKFIRIKNAFLRDGISSLNLLSSSFGMGMGIVEPPHPMAKDYLLLLKIK
jgi:hypothetical protein